MVPVVANLKLEINSKKVLRDPSPPVRHVNFTRPGAEKSENRAVAVLVAGQSKQSELVSLELRLQGNFLHTGAGTETECSFPRYAPARPPL